jgi:hypothetical protein
MKFSRYRPATGCCHRQGHQQALPVFQFRLDPVHPFLRPSQPLHPWQTTIEVALRVGDSMYNFESTTKAVNVHISTVE